MQQLHDKIDRVLAMPPYEQPPGEKQALLLDLLKEELAFACERHSGYKSYVDHWPVSYRSAARIGDLPYLPVGILKSNPPLSFVDPKEVKRVLTSSATTSQSPSRVVLDAPTARRLTKGTIVIVRNFIGAARRPYLVVDAPDQKAGTGEMGARSAAIQGLHPFASEATYCLNLHGVGDLTLDMDRLTQFADKHRDSEILMYGFTYILWNQLVKPLMQRNVCLNLSKAHVLHSGGWKRLHDQAVEKNAFNERLAMVVGCSPQNIVDFYGMVESVGVIFPDCAQGNKHGPIFGDVIVRDPLTLEPVLPGERGIVQVCSVLPTSFPGNLLLTEDMAEVISYDGCPCGRRGISFRFAGRIPKAEIRGCGNLENQRKLNN